MQIRQQVKQWCAYTDSPALQAAQSRGTAVPGTGDAVQSQSSADPQTAAAPWNAPPALGTATTEDAVGTRSPTGSPASLPQRLSPPAMDPAERGSNLITTPSPPHLTDSQVTSLGSNAAGVTHANAPSGAAADSSNPTPSVLPLPDSGATRDGAALPGEGVNPNPIPAVTGPFPPRRGWIHWLLRCMNCGCMPDSGEAE